MVDEEYRHPRLAAIYDVLDPDRRDLEWYAGVVEEFGGRRVLDVGCGPERWRSGSPTADVRWTEVTDVDGPPVTFRTTWRFAADGAPLTSTSTLRFRERDEVEADPRATGFTVVDVRDAPHRPGLEFVVIARRA